MKTVKSRLLALLLCLSMLFCLPTFAAEEEKENFLQNGTFETLDETGMYPAGWIPQGGTWGEGAVSLTEDSPFEGKCALKIDNASGQYSAPWAYTEVRGLAEGGLYEITIRVKTEGFIADSAAGCKVEAYDAYGNNTYGKDGTVRFAADSVNTWAEAKGSFTVPEGTEHIKLYCRLYSTTGAAYFDDVRLTLGDPPEKFHFNVNTKVQYADDESGTATVKVDNFYAAENVGEHTSVDFSVIDPENGAVLDSWTADSMPGDSVTYTYPLEKLSVLQKEYKVQAVVKDKDGMVLGEYADIVAKFKRPPRITKDGQYVIDGEVFYPSIAYHLNESDYARAAEIGINVVQLNGTNAATVETAVNKAAEYGIKSLVCLYAEHIGAGNPDQIDATKAVVETLKGNENVFAYAPQDEPMVKGNTPENRDELWTAYTEIRKIDEDTPVFIIDAFSNLFYEDVKFCDIFWSENYSAGAAATKMAAVQADEAENAGKIFGVLAGTYTSSAERPIKSSDLVRDTLYRSFAEGSMGIGYYSISDAGYNGDPLYKAAPDTWAGLSVFSKEEQKEAFDYYAGRKYSTFGRYYKTTTDGYGEYYEAWVKDGNLMLVIHNQTVEEKEMEIPLISGNGVAKIGAFTATPIGGSTETITGSGSLKVTVPASHPILYRVTPTEAVDFSLAAAAEDGKNHFAPPGSETEEGEESVKPTGSFSDLSGYEWASEQIQALYGQGVVNDRNIYAFAPGENITREDYVTFLVRALGIEGEGEAFPDCDVPEVATARGAGIVNGDTDGNFRPADPITRQDVFTIAARSAKVSELSDISEAEAMFSDWAFVSEYACGSIAAMVKAGVILGNGDGTVNPLGFTTRAEAAVLLHRLQNTDFSKLQGEMDTPGAQPEQKEEITFSENPAEDLLQKWSDAADLIKSVGIGEIAVETSVTKGEFEALIQNLTGAQYNVFSEDDKALLYSEAVEELVKLLGYEVYTARDGGYLGVASRIDLTKGITNEGEYIRGGALALLLRNAVDILLCEPTSFGSGAVGTYAKKDETLLSAYKNIYRYDGVVSDNYETANDLKKGEIRIDSNVFYGESVGDFIGQRVTVYAEGEEDKTALYIAPRSSVTVTEMDAEKIVPDKTTTGCLVYESENGKEITEKISGAVLIKNGRRKDGWTAADITPASGSVTLIANTGSGADYILVWSYTNYVVDSVYAADNLITVKEGESISVDFEKDDVKGSFLRSVDSKEAVLQAVTEYNVLSVAESEDKKVKRILLTSKAVNGIVTEVSDKAVVIDDTEYKVAVSLQNSVKLIKPELGQTASYSLDFNGKVAAVNTSMVIRNYGYFVTAALGKGLSGGITFRILGRDGEMKYLKGAESMLFNGQTAKPEDFLASTLLFNGEDPIGQLIVYETNEAGELTELTTATDNRHIPFIEQGGIPEFSLVGDAVKSRDDKEGRVLYYKVGSKYRFNAATTVFLVPPAYSEKDADYAIGENAIVLEHDKSLGDVLFYDFSSNYYIGAMVIQATPESVTNNSSPYGVVIGKTTVLDADGMASTGLRVVNKRGEEETLLFPNADFAINFGDQTLTNISQDVLKTASGGRPKTITPSQLDEGDVISWEVNSLTGQVSAALCVLRANSVPADGTTWPAAMMTEWSKSFNTQNHFFGWYKMDRVFELGFATTKPFEWLFNFWSYYTRYAVLVYERDTGKCYKIDYSDVREGEHILYACWAYMMQIGVVYR